MRWRFLDSGALDGAEQMALDAGLMDRAHETGEAVLRVYAWSQPTLSFGRHESVLGRFSPEVLDRANVRAVRRPTGGRALLHDREVTYSVTAPAPEGGSLGLSYGRINALLLEALARLGVRASAASPGPATRPGHAVCFAEPSAGELVVHGRKLVGSAQVRERGAMLQHGSILVGDDQPRIAKLAVGPLTPALSAATLADCLGRAPAYEEVRDALLASLRAQAGDVATLDAAEAAPFAAPHRAQFLSVQWTWRR
ncbi:MAG: biotin/lipoate A/B protein ligase family protein, partial [Gemmatimonadales bacterium]